MRETEVEGHLFDKVKEAGGLCWKWVSPGQRGVPDRIVIMPGGLIVFVETKAPGKTERASQKNVHRKLRQRGCVVYASVDTKEKVDALIVHLTRQSDLLCEQRRDFDNGV